MMINNNDDKRCYECIWCGDDGLGIYNNEVHVCTCVASPYFGERKWAEEDMRCTCDKMEDIYINL